MGKMDMIMAANKFTSQTCLRIIDGDAREGSSIAEQVGWASYADEPACGGGRKGGALLSGAFAGAGRCRCRGRFRGDVTGSLLFEE